MLVGYAPFCAQETREVCKRIIDFKKYLQFPPEIKLSKEAEDLIKQLINDSNNRLGKNGSDEIKSHPFFNGVDWENIRTTMKPPFIPDIKDDADTKYFETFEKIEPFYPETKGIKKRKDMEYVGFTYNEDNEENMENIYKNINKIIDNFKNVEVEKEKEDENKNENNDK